MGRDKTSIESVAERSEATSTIADEVLKRGLELTRSVLPWRRSEGQILMALAPILSTQALELAALALILRALKYDV